MTMGFLAPRPNDWSGLRMTHMAETRVPRRWHMTTCVSNSFE